MLYQLSYSRILFEFQLLRLIAAPRVLLRSVHSLPKWGGNLAKR